MTDRKIAADMADELHARLVMYREQILDPDPDSTQPIIDLNEMIKLAEKLWKELSDDK